MSTVHRDAFIRGFSYKSEKDANADVPANQRKKLAVAYNIGMGVSYIPGISLISGIVGLSLLGKMGRLKTMSKTQAGKAFIARTVLTMFFGPVVALLDVIATIMKAHLNKKASKAPKNAQKV